MKGFITDAYGQRYQINVIENSDAVFCVELRHRREYVGKAKCTLRPPDTMELSDIYIRDDSDPPENVIERIMKDSARPKELTISYRRRCIGTSIVKISYC